MAKQTTQQQEEKAKKDKRSKNNPAERERWMAAKRQGRPQQTWSPTYGWAHGTKEAQ